MEAGLTLRGGIASALGKLAVLACVGAPGLARAACPPVAVVEGPAVIATATAAILRRHGVESAPGACAGRMVRALLTANAETHSYALRIEDGFGRANERVATDAETAASLIESWVLDEDADVLAPRLVSAAVPAAAGGPAEAQATSQIAAPPFVAPPGPAAPRWRLFGAAERSIAAEPAAWFGGSVTGFHRAGPVCVGARARRGRARESEQLIAELFDASFDHTALDGLAVAALPVRLGRVTLSPLVGLGVGWTRSTISRAPLEMSWSEWGPRAEAAMIVDVGVGAGWSLLAELGASAGPRTGSRAQWELSPPRSEATAATVRAGIGVGYSR